MPLTSIELESTNPIIVDGKFITFDLDVPFPGHPGLISDGLILDRDSYSLMGCEFPSKELSQPHYDESLEELKTILNNNINMGGKNYFFDAGEIILSVVPKNIDQVNRYRYINGVVYDGVTKIDNLYGGIYLPTTFDDNDQIYYINETDQTLHTITLETALHQETLENGETITTRKYVISKTIDSSGTYVNNDFLSDDNLERLKGRAQSGKLENASISIDQNTINASKFGTPEVDNDLRADGIVNVNISYIERFIVRIGYIKTIMSAMDPDDALTVGEGENRTLDSLLVNGILLSTGFANYVDDRSGINNLSEPMIWAYDIGFPSYRKIGYDAGQNIWALDFWKDKITKTPIAQGISWSKLRTFISCNYRFFRAKLDKADYRFYDKGVSEVGLTKGANIIGTIIHTYSEYLIRETMKTGSFIPATDDQILAFRKAATNNLLGQDLNTLDFPFTADDVARIKTESKNDGFKLIAESLNNINSRDFYSDYDTFFTEVPLANGIYDASGDFIDRIVRRFNISGFIDAVLYNTDTKKVAIYDIKTNEVFRGSTRIDGKFKPLTLTGNDQEDKQEVISNPGTIDRAQVVWYVYFAIQRGYLVEGNQITEPFLYDDNGNPRVAQTEAEILEVLANPDIETFFDLTRYTGNNAKVKVDPDERVAIWRFYIAPALNLLAKEYETLDNGFLNVNNVQTTPGAGGKTNNRPKICNFCEYLSTCPAYKNNRENVADISGINQNDKPLYAITTSARDISIQEDKAVHGLVKTYYDLALKGPRSKSRYSTQKNRSKVDLIQRTRAIRPIDQQYETQIGAVYISSPIISINAYDNKRHTSSTTLRSPMPVTHRVEGSDKQIVIAIRFNSEQKINSEMRHIYAQTSATSFISIRNPDITRIVLPFDTNQDIYNSIADKVLLKKYYDVKGNSNRPDTGNVDLPDSPGEIKNLIYKNARLYYSIQEIKISDVPGAVDTIDMYLRIQLIDTLSITTQGIVRYLSDTSMVLAQHAHMYNNSVSVNSSPVSIASQVIDSIVEKPAKIDLSSIETIDFVRIEIDESIFTNRKKAIDIEDGVITIYSDYVNNTLIFGNPGNNTKAKSKNNNNRNANIKMGESITGGLSNLYRLILNTYKFRISEKPSIEISEIKEDKFIVVSSNGKASQSASISNNIGSMRRKLETYGSPYQSITSKTNISGSSNPEATNVVIRPFYRVDTRTKGFSNNNLRFVDVPLLEIPLGFIGKRRDVVSDPVYSGLLKPLQGTFSKSPEERRIFITDDKSDVAYQSFMRRDVCYKYSYSARMGGGSKMPDMVGGPLNHPINKSSARENDTSTVVSNLLYDKNDSNANVSLGINDIRIEIGKPIITNPKVNRQYHLYSVTISYTNGDTDILSAILILEFEKDKNVKYFTFGLYDDATGISESKISQIVKSNIINSSDASSFSVLGKNLQGPVDVRILLGTYYDFVLSEYSQFFKS